MLTEKEIKKVLFFDMEVVGKTYNLNDLPDEMIYNWEKKCASTKFHREIDLGQSIDKLYKKYAPIYFEFAKIVAISFGAYSNKEGKYVVKNYYIGDGKCKNEFDVVSKFVKLLMDVNRPLCGWNIKDYDIPLLCQRAICLGIKLPQRLLEISLKKPWELDQVYIEMTNRWAFGSYSGKAQKLSSVCYNLGVKTPKDVMDGADVNAEFHTNNNFTQIGEYCDKDVWACIELCKKVLQTQK